MRTEALGFGFKYDSVLAFIFKWLPLQKWPLVHFGLVLPQVPDPMILQIPASIALLVRNRLQKAVVEHNANSGCPTGKHPPVVESFSTP
jgi:hypothetical protein